MRKIFIVRNSFDELYVEICKNVYEGGNSASPRNLPTVEKLGNIFVLENPLTRCLQNEIRNISLPFAVAEWLWCMKGANDLEMISYYAPSYRKYSDNGITLHGAYGPRIQKYLPKIINLLQKDEHSRRAVIPIYTIHDVAIESKDIPCTSSIQFLIRNGRLNLIVHMRSNDIYLGLPYDVFNFTMLQEYVARKLNVQIGTYTHIVNSLHYYKKNEETIKRIAYSAPAKAKEMPLMPKDDLDNRLQELIKYEEELRINGNKIKVPNEGYFGNLAFILYKYSKDREMSTHDSSSSILHSSFK